VGKYNFSLPKINLAGFLFGVIIQLRFYFAGVMKKRIIFLLFGSALFLGFFEFNLWYLQPQDISFSSYFSGIYASVFVPESDKTIRINLYNKSLTLFENDTLFKQAKISAAGNPYAFPTPVGNFKILSKEKQHISGLSGLIMPFSLRFYKGYYLHALPTYRSGQPFNSTYSVGCIRLDNELAMEIFNWAEIGTKVEIYNSSLVRSDESLTVYHLNQDGTKEPITSPEEFIKRGFRWQDIATIPAAELSALPLVNLELE